MIGALADDNSFYDEEFHYDAPPGPGKVHMSRIVMNISKLNATQLAGKLQLSFTAIAEDAVTFTGATAMLTLGNTTRQDLVDGQALVDSLAAQLAQAREARDQALATAADFYEHHLVVYVNGIAKGDASIILAAGLEVAQPPGPSPAMGKVENVKLTSGGNDGTAFANWDPMYRSRSYEVQLTSDPNNPALWTTYDIVTAAGLGFGGLPSGQKRWVRVRAIGHINKGVWSDPACCTIS